MTESIRQELQVDEIEKMGRHAGHLSREIAIKSEARKLAAAKAKEEIDELQAELDTVLNDLHHGFRLIPAQQKLFDPEQENTEISPQDEVNHRRSKALHDLNVYALDQPEDER